MQARWYYQQLDGTFTGPVSVTKLKVLASHGFIDPEQLVKNSLAGKWIRAASIKGLFETIQDTPQGRATVEKSREDSGSDADDSARSVNRRICEAIACAALLLGAIIGIAYLYSAVTGKKANRKEATAPPTELATPSVDKPQMPNDAPLPAKNVKPHVTEPKPSLPATEIIDNTYETVVIKIKGNVLINTINPSSAEWCPRFEIIINQRGNQVYVGWYTSTDVLGVRGKDNIIAEVDSRGNVIRLKIGGF